MTFGQLQTAVYQVCGYPTPVQPIVVGRVKNWLNEAHRHCLRQPGLVELRQRTGFPFTSVAGQDVYNFPLAFERVDAVVERTSHRRLRNLSRDVFRSVDPAETSIGTPTCYVPEGWQPRIRRPTTNPLGTPLWVASVSPLDTTQISRLQTIRVIGDPNVPYEATLQGTTPVLAIDTTRGNIMDIVSWTLTSACAGYAVLLDAPVTLVPPDFDQAHVVARIPPGHTSAMYWCLRLWPTPSAAIPYYVDGQIEIRELVHETDVPMLPLSYHDLLAVFARMREYERTGDRRLAIAAAEWEHGLAQLRAFVNFPDDWKPVAGSIDSAIGWTNLGGYFPADRSWP